MSDWWQRAPWREEEPPKPQGSWTWKWSWTPWKEQTPSQENSWWWPEAKEEEGQDEDKSGACTTDVAELLKVGRPDSVEQAQMIVVGAASLAEAAVVAEAGEEAQDAAAGQSKTGGEHVQPQQSPLEGKWIWKRPPARYWAHIFLDKQYDFELVPTLIGRQGKNMKRIVNAAVAAGICQKSSTKARVRGRGSGHLEVDGKREAPVPLMLAITVSKKESKEFRIAVKTAVGVLEELDNQYCSFCQKCGLQVHRRFGKVIFGFGEISTGADKVIQDYVDLYQGPMVPVKKVTPGGLIPQMASNGDSDSEADLVYEGYENDDDSAPTPRVVGPRLHQGIQALVLERHCQVVTRSRTAHGVAAATSKEMAESAKLKHVRFVEDATQPQGQPYTAGEAATTGAREYHCYHSQASDAVFTACAAAAVAAWHQQQSEGWTWQQSEWMTCAAAGMHDQQEQGLPVCRWPPALQSSPPAQSWRARAEGQDRMAEARPQEAQPSGKESISSII